MSILIFSIGAVGYGFLELVFRGYTHWTMMLTGGACLLTFYYFNRQYKKTPLLLKAFWGALIISIYEFSVGLIVNRWFDWHVWDYSGEPGNILGLVCPAFTLMWFFLCLFGLLISKGLYYGYRHFRP